VDVGRKRSVVVLINDLICRRRGKLRHAGIFDWCRALPTKASMRPSTFPASTCATTSACFILDGGNLALPREFLTLTISTP
jgi:hypothetical protein